MNKYLSGYNINIEVSNNILLMWANLQGKLFEWKCIIDDMKYFQVAVENGFVSFKRTLKRKNLI